MDKKKILVVEDDMDNYELVRVILEHGGYDVFLAVNGRDGVDAARLQQPDLILMDLGLPEMDGWDAAEKIKADKSTKTIPLYALTAHTLPRDRLHALQVGVDGYFTKPLHVESFLAEIKKTFEKKKGKRRPRKLIF
jgi:DNA-binding response OmpR family regulator